MAALKPPAAERRRPALLTGLVAAQALAAVFFAADAATDLLNAPWTPHTLIEAFVALALGAGVVIGAVELRAALERLRAQETALAAARGALSTVVAAQFRDWALTPAETDVAWLALKGLDVAEIAALRGSAQGTVRAQLARVYAKAGVSGRAQFAALFVEELLAQGVPEADGAHEASRRQA